MTHPLRWAVARAIAACVAPQIDDWIEQNWPTYLPEADAAIAATLAGIREPSEGMLNSAICNPTNENITVARRNVAAFSWRAMIDALAKEVAADG